MYLFELIFRAELSPVAVAHHIGSVIIAATAVAISMDPEHQKDALLEFLLCLLWGESPLS
jgi:molybdopterin synthase catalytic subunit